ncbi:MAG: NUDIX domain-containing protein [Planctomycetota bacterium]|jgi:8-oxo-dGTP diphosphatase
MAKKGKYVYDWPRPMVSVDAVVFKFFGSRAKLLLVNRKNEPFRGQWALPGGYVEIEEELENAAARELAEETGLTDVQLEQMRTFGKCGRDPRGRQITIAFMGISTKRGAKIRAGDDAGQVRWFDIENLPTDMAFDHNEVSRFAIRKLKRKRIYRLNATQKRTD